MSDEAKQRLADEVFTKCDELEQALNRAHYGGLDVAIIHWSPTDPFSICRKKTHELNVTVTERRPTPKKYNPTNQSHSVPPAEGSEKPSTPRPV